MAGFIVMINNRLIKFIFALIFSRRDISSLIYSGFSSQYSTTVSYPHMNKVVTTYE